MEDFDEIDPSDDQAAGLDTAAMAILDSFPGGSGLDEATVSFDDEEEVEATPGFSQTTYGQHPWGAGGSGGYRPYSQQQTGMERRALGNDDPVSEPVARDAMSMEPEVLAAEQATTMPGGGWNEANEDIDPQTIYDRDSYESNDSSQATVGSGIFDNEEGVTFRARDGQFQHQYALPAYLAKEDELGVQQSEMWDSTAQQWRVTQPSAGGVSLLRGVRRLKAPPAGLKSSHLRPEHTGPRSHIEAFGRKAAQYLIEEARAYPAQSRAAFLAGALRTLHPSAAARARAVAERLVTLGYPPETALEDTVAHIVMHAAAQDLIGAASGQSGLGRIEAFGKRFLRTKRELRGAAAKHLGPLTSNREVLRRDLGALYRSSAGRGMGEITAGTTAAPATGGIVTGRNLLIAGGVGLGVYLLYRNRQTIAKNARKLGRRIQRAVR